MPPSKIPCLQCPTLVSKTNITHLCRTCYLVYRRQSKPSSSASSRCLGSPPLPSSKLIAFAPGPTPTPHRKPSVQIPPSTTRTPRSANPSVFQPRRLSHHLNFFDHLPPDLLLYLSKYLHLQMATYLLDEQFANRVKKAYANLGQLSCLTSRLFPLSNKIYTGVGKMAWSINQIRCIFDSYVCGVNPTRLKKPATHYYYGRDSDVASAHSQIEYIGTQRAGRKKARSFPEECVASVRVAILDLQTINQIIAGFSKTEVQKLPVSSTKGLGKVFPKYLKDFQGWLIRIQPYLADDPVPTKCSHSPYSSPTGPRLYMNQMTGLEIFKCYEPELRKAFGLPPSSDPPPTRPVDLIPFLPFQPTDYPQ